LKVLVLENLLNFFFAIVNYNKEALSLPLALIEVEILAAFCGEIAT
jgi:hypothetical protein